MKSQVSVLLHVVEGLCEDASLTYPALKEGFLKDYERIALCCQSRGLSFFTLDLPHLDALLLSGLELGRLELEGPCSTRVSSKTRVPRLFSGLWLRIFDKNACLRPDADPTAIAFLRQLSVIGKKLEVECSAERRDDVLRRYYHVEGFLRMPTLQWASDEIDASLAGKLSLTDGFDRLESDSVSLFDSRDLGETRDQRDVDRDKHLLNRCQQVADILLETLGFIEPVAYSYRLEREGHGIGFKHGPGAVAERLGQHEKSSFPNWPHKLEQWFPFVDCARSIGDTRDRPLNHEPASRLICVPKTAKGPRLIAAEPVAHQWCQQIVWRWLQDSLMSNFDGFFINFKRQELSGDMVIQASLDRKLATVDLSDASDRLTCWTVERMFRRNPSLISVLHAARTRYLRDDITGTSSFIKLKKFASQGTATTFPVQSIVFLCIALASCFDSEEPTMARIWALRNQVRVYGDDIIIPRHGYWRLLRLMDLLQLKVNVTKSYVHGYFRESCGQDGYAGCDVTPVKPKRVVGNGPDSIQAVIDTSNNLFNKGYWNASHNLISHLPRGVQSNLRIVGLSESGFSGLTSFSGSDESHLRKRWNPRLHRYEGRVWGVSPKSKNETREGFVPFLDFCSRPYNPWYPRIVSEFGRTRKTRSRLLWEPLNMGAHSDACMPRYRRVGTLCEFLTEQFLPPIYRCGGRRVPRIGDPGSGHCQRLSSLQPRHTLHHRM